MDAARDTEGAALRQGRDLWRADPRRTCGEQSGPAGAGPRIRDPIERPDVSRAGMRHRLVRRRPQKPRARARRAVSVRDRGGHRVPAGRCAAPPSSRRTSRRMFAYIGGGFGGRDHTPFPLYVALAAMFFPGRPVRLALRPLSAVSSGHQAARLQDAHADRRRSRDRQDRRIRRRSRAGWRRPRQFFRHRCDRRRHRARSASTTFRKSISPRSRSIRAA